MNDLGRSFSGLNNESLTTFLFGVILAAIMSGLVLLAIPMVENSTLTPTPSLDILADYSSDAVNAARELATMYVNPIAADISREKWKAISSLIDEVTLDVLKDVTLYAKDAITFGEVKEKAVFRARKLALEVDSVVNAAEQ